MVKGPLNPNITSLTEELIGNLKTKIYSCYIRGKSTNDNKKRKNENFRRKNIVRAQTDTHKVTTEGTFQGFRIFSFYLSPRIGLIYML